jgi:hypothetical protein
VAPNICGFVVWKLCDTTLLATRILSWLLDFWKICVQLSKVATALIADVEVLDSLVILQLYYCTKLNVLAARVEL